MTGHFIVHGRSNDGLYGSSVDLTAMTYLVDGDCARRVVDQIDDAVVALPDAISVRIARELLRATRTRVSGESLNLGDDLLAIDLRADGLKFLPCGRLDQETI